jgi:sulfur relay (sulfurtransferase) complex TusBCD TusD component (DsrE family)
MKKYLLIESQDPLENGDVLEHYRLAADLAQAGNEVTLFLVQNGVFPARASQASDALASTTRAGVTVLADGFSLRERGIATRRLIAGVAEAPLDTVVDRLAAGHRVLWH